MKGSYGESSNGNFKVVDSISVPHPYCITPKHVEVASRDFGGMLGEDAILAAERKGVRCGTKTHEGNCKLAYYEHEQALLIGCNKELKDEKGEVNPELHRYLLSIKEECEKNGYVGFAFKKGM